MSFLVLFGLMIVFLGACFVRVRLEAWRLSRLDFDGLLGCLKPVPSSGISTVALDYLQPIKGQLQIEPAELWALIGEDEGVRRMYANAKILIALAGYAQRWNLEESVVVAERMRRDGVTLRRAALWLSMPSFLRYADPLLPFNVQELASSYFLMKNRLLALYESSHVGRYPILVAAL